MIHHGRRIKIKIASSTSIFVFGDLQYRQGSPAFDSNAWEMFKEEFKTTPNAYALGLGDYEDWLRPSMRARLQGAFTGDDEARQQMDNKVRRDQDTLLDKMQFLGGKLIGLHSGHHEWEFSDGTNSTQRICSALKAKYLGWMASTRLNISVDRADGKKGGYSYTIVSMHGSGTAQFASTDARFLETRVVPAWIANHYIRGHSCKSMAWNPFARRLIRRQGPYGEQEQTVRCMNVGGFSRAYTDGHKSDYVERQGLLPQPVSWGVIRFKIRISKETAAKNGTKNRAGKLLDVEQLVRQPHKEPTDQEYAM